MSDPAPDQNQNGITASAPAAAAPLTQPPGELVEQGNLALGLAVGACAALVGAVLWAVITVATGYQIGFMAVGIGFLAGVGVGKFGRGSSLPYQVSGAALALLGCLAGNFLTVIGFAARHEGMGYFELLGKANPAAVVEIMVKTAQPMDLLFYAIAVYEGFKFSSRR